jgi:hypothetical protein
MNIICENDAGAPQSFYDDEARAVQILNAAFPNNIDVRIKVGYGNYNGTPLPTQSISEGGVANNAVFLTYTQLRNYLLTFGEPGFFNNQNLPPFNDPNSPGHTNFWISSSEAKAFGIATTGTIDGFVGIGRNFVAGNERVSAFLHEIGHALGRIQINFTSGGTTYWSALDLWRFTSNGNRYFDGNSTTSTRNYFSTDGGLNHLADWGMNSDPSDFLGPSSNPPSNLTPNDPFDENVGNLANLTNVDLLITEALGFRRTPPGPPPPAPNPAPPPGTTADMILRHGSDGKYEIYDIGQNRLLAAYYLGQVGTDWNFYGLGGFFGKDTTDMMLRNYTTGGLEVYDISNNKITNAAFLGTIGLDWLLMGYGNFSSFGETDMMLRNSRTGGVEVYDIRNNQIIGANFMGTVGLDWQIGGYGNFSSRGTSDMIMRNTRTGGLEVYDINSNQITGAHFLGNVGLDWSILAFGDFSSRTGTTDMIMRNTRTGSMFIYDINNDQITSAYSIGAVGLDWQFAGVAPVHAAGAADLVLRNTNTGAFQVYDIAFNQLTGSASLGVVGLDWSLGGLAVDPPEPEGGAMGQGQDSTSQLVQAMAGFDGGGAAESLNAAAFGSEMSPQALLTTSQHA